MANSNHNIGNAGEFAVLSQLAHRGYIAAKTDDGQTLIDVIATNPETLRSINIQVKTTKHESADYWMMSAKNEEVFESLWYVLVALGEPDARPVFHIFHSSEVGPWLKEDHASWLSKPKRNGEERKDSNMRKFRPSLDQLANARENWEALFS